jgi:hypothetical protein
LSRHKTTKKYVGKHRKEREFTAGDMVYLKIQPYRHTSLSLHRSLKLHSKFYGPFRVLARVEELAYILLYYLRAISYTLRSMLVSSRSILVER